MTKNESFQLIKLPAEIVKAIAAGQIILRPVSAVKELVDNALDAGATKISIELAAGGRDLIRITDNGRGLPPAAMRLAIQPHTTSKLLLPHDLSAAGSFRFRGEALAALAAASQLTVASKPPSDQLKLSIHLTNPRQAVRHNRNLTLAANHRLRSLPVGHQSWGSPNSSPTPLAPPTAGRNPVSFYLPARPTHSIHPEPIRNRQAV